MLDQLINISIDFVFTIFKYGFTTYEFIKKNIKRISPDNITISEYIIYENFEIHTYKFIKNNDVYLFDFIFKKEDMNNIQLLDELLNDTSDNLIEKHKNKKKILHASIMTDTETILCDITEVLKKLAYYFDCYNEIEEYNEQYIEPTESETTEQNDESEQNEESEQSENGYEGDDELRMACDRRHVVEDEIDIVDLDINVDVDVDIDTDTDQSIHKLYWKDILEIVNMMYKKNIQSNSIYLYIILNDDQLTEKTILFSSILNKKVRF